MRTTRAALVAAALTVGITACGGGSEPTAEAGSFDEALGLDQQSIRERETKVQEAVRECMKAQGFEYIPVDPSRSGMQVRFGGMEIQDLDRLRKEGYGITSLPDRAVRPDEGDDPNQAIRERLSEADRVAYERALFGAEAATPNEGGGAVVRRRFGGSDDGERVPFDEGCFGKAQRQVPGGPEELGEALGELQQRIQNDPRLVEVNREWAACMAESGYADWQQPNEIEEDLFGRLQELMGGEDGTVTFDDADADNAALGRLRAEELAIAGTDADCRERTGHGKVLRQVREDAEQRFLDEHPDLSAG